MDKLVTTGHVQLQAHAHTQALAHNRRNTDGRGSVHKLHQSLNNQLQALRMLYISKNQGQKQTLFL